MSKKVLFIFLILFVGIFLHIRGINWGVPDRERISLVFGNRIILEDLIEPMTTTHQEIREMQVYYGAEYRPDYDTSKKIDVLINGKRKKVSIELINSMRSYLLRSYGADEQAVLASLSKMNPKKLDLNPHFFEYGGTYIYPLAGFLYLCSLTGLIDLKNDMKEYMFEPEKIGDLYTFSRLFGAITFILSSLVFFFFCLRITRDSIISFLITVLFVSIPGFAIWSHYLKPYTSGMLWVVCCLYFTFRYVEEKKTIWLVLSSVFAGFSMASLLSYGYVIISVIFSIFFVGLSTKKFFKNLLISLTCFVISYFVTNPYVLISWKEFISEISYIQSYWKGTASLYNLKYFFTTSLKYGLGISMWLMFIFSSVISLLKFDKKILLVLLSLIPAFFYFGLSTGRWVHYSFIIYPYIFLLILLNFLKIKRIIAIAMLCISFFWTFVFTCSYVNLFAQENIRTIAGRWINSNIPKQSNIGLLEAPSPWRTPPFQYLTYNIFFGTPEQYRPQYFVVSEYQWVRGSSLREIEKILTDYEIVKEFRKDTSFFKLKFSNPENIPYDWCHPNPVILIWEKKT